MNCNYTTATALPACSPHLSVVIVVTQLRCVNYFLPALEPGVLEASTDSRRNMQPNERSTQAPPAAAVAFLKSETLQPGRAANITLLLQNKGDMPAR